MHQIIRQGEKGCAGAGQGRVLDSTKRKKEQICGWEVMVERKTDKLLAWTEVGGGGRGKEGGGRTKFLPP